MVPKDWWLEDISELDIELYKRVIHAVQAKGAPQELVGESIRLYTLKCLPELSANEPGSKLMTGKDSLSALETIVDLLPSERGSCSCSFLLRLLKAATFLDASASTKLELARRVGLQLDEASLHDLIMIPSDTDSACDVDLVIRILEHYMTQFLARPGQLPDPEQKSTTLLNEIAIDTHAVEHRMTAATHASHLKVAKLIDRYLAEVARHPDLPLAKFIQLAESVPDFARPVHDGLYRAIDMYLKVGYPEVLLSGQLSIAPV